MRPWLWVVSRPRWQQEGSGEAPVAQARRQGWGKDEFGAGADIDCVIDIDTDPVVDQTLR